MDLIESKAPCKIVKSVQFGLFSPEEIRKTSVIPEGIRFLKIIKGKHHLKVDSLIDPRMGVPNDGTRRCQTCAGDIINCPGHFGHIELAKPIFHINFLWKISTILQCICYSCSKLQVTPAKQNNLKKILKMTIGKPSKRLELVHQLCRNGPNKCRGCGNYQPKIRITGIELMVEWKDADGVPQEENNLLAEDVLPIFKNISDTDCCALGMDPKFSRPEWMILTVLLVPPVAMRPVVDTTGWECTNDLTNTLNEIIQANNKLISDIKGNAAPHELLENIRNLQKHVAAFIDNNVPGFPEMLLKSGQPITGIKSRLEGKEGRVRGNLMGKRVNFSARSVITPDPNLKINELGVPEAIAKNMTYPEIITPFNIDKMLVMARNGPTQYPDGATYIIRQNGVRINLRFPKDRSKILLEVGDKVERYLTNGDLVVFNRQPTLHKMSMMGYRVKVLPFSTFRMNLSCTTPYNADFDGDEMNIHVPQSLETRAEVEYLHMTSRQILTPQANKPVMGIVQDALIAATKMTQRDVFLNRGQFMNLLMFLPSWDGHLPKPAILKPAPRWTGKQLFSQIIPRKLNVLRTHAAHLDEEDNELYKWIPPRDTKVLVENGQLIMGILCKRTLGACAGSLLHVCMLELGHKVSGEFYENIQTVVNEWLFGIRGHSVGIFDIMPDPETDRKIQEAIEQAKTEVAQVTQRMYNMELELTPGNNLKQTFEQEVNRLLNEVRDNTGKVVKRSLTRYNSLKMMIVTGSKGSDLNMSQIMGCVGQQNVTGKRIQNGFQKRTLPHYMKGDVGPEAGGFVKNSYYSGLVPTEFFFHAMGGCDGLIGTASKTSETGHIQRRLIKTMESLIVEYNGPVRNPTGLMVQSCYGEDGLAGEYLEFQNLPTVKLSNTELEKKCKLDIKNKSYLKRNFTEDVNKNLSVSDKVVSELEREWKQLKQDRKILMEIFPTGKSQVVLPCNLERMIWNAQKMFCINKRKPTDLSPLIVVQEVRKLLEKCIVVGGNDGFSKMANYNATLLFKCLARSMLNTKSVAEYKLNTKAFEWLMNEIKRKFRLALVVPGEAVGILAAQSLGEPTSQMALNTFHFAGVSSKNIALGASRLREIIDVSEHSKSASMTVYLKVDVACDLEKTQNVLCRLKHTTLKSLTLSSAIFHDPDPHNTVIPEDQEFVDSFYEFLGFNATKVLPWLLRMELDDKKMINRKICMKQIAAKIFPRFHRRLFCIFSDDNADKLVLRIRVLKNVAETVHDEENSDIDDDLGYIKYIQDTLLGEITLKGIPKISNIYKHKPQTNKKKRRVVNEDGSLNFVSEWVLETDGTDLANVFGDPDVDSSRTVTNDISDTFNVLGIEAARKTVEMEMNAVLQCYSLYINNRHLSLLCDVMSAKGSLMPLNRYGINKQNVGPLMKCSFEGTVDVLLEAAYNAEADPVKGVSERIIVGQPTKVGTGCVDLLLDLKKYERILSST